MARTVGIGIQRYNDMIERNCFYVDKTDFIREWWESEDSVTLLTRPRRFGKTLAMSMVEQFFSVEYAGREDLFEGLSIWKEEKYRDLQGTYPVMFLTFADVKARDCKEVMTQIKQNITDLYNRHDYLLKGDLLNEKERNQYASIEPGMDNAVAATAIRAMANYLSRYYGKNVIILLDEYDTPMQEAYVEGFWEELTAFTRNLFNSTFKTNPWLERAIMTGITRVSKESIFSDLNNLEVVTTTSDKYATSFGFTEEEVFAAMDEYGYEEKEEVKFWYDGFVFGTHSDIYNPWSILNYLKKREFRTYWAPEDYHLQVAGSRQMPASSHLARCFRENTSSNSLVSKLIREGSKQIKISFEALLAGEHLKTPIDEQIVYDQLDGNEQAIWSLLLASGYLKVVSYEKYETYRAARNYERPVYELELTNLEVKIMFQDMVHGWFGSVNSDYNDFIKALLDGDVKAMNAYMNRVALATFSFFDTGKNPSGSEPERFYHGFVLGLMVELSERYTISSNRESGFGRYDVLMEPKNKADFAYILEFKVHDPEDEDTLQETVRAALVQINEKKYETNLLEKGIPEERIRKYGFAFEGKTVLIGQSAQTVPKA